ncbi:MAG: aminotransferase class V-fold PLP-dependent enzyme [Candidatus Sumerlaeota bacterium]|nr:aminotransferase class V-fold PLP-dependent enzyme [Candidatus Sumerlaeota bacterium]
MIFPRKVYLDHNATTPVGKPVRRVMERVLRGVHGNPSSLHTQGRTARGCVEQARMQVAALLGCAPEQMIFTSGGTEGNNAVIKGVFARAGKGHIITSRIEHESVLGACQQVEAMGGKVTYLMAGRDGLVKPSDVRTALQPDTILISIMHANNETGAIQPVEEIGAIAREANVPFHTDAVQSYGKIPTLVDKIGCEFLTLTAHKINGPKGAGAIYGRGAAKWAPLIFGGDQEHRMRAGTEATHQIAGLGAAAELAAARMAGEFERLTILRRRFIEGLKKVRPDARVNEAPAGHQMPGSLNLTFPGVEGIRLLAGLDCYEVCVSIGSACTADRVEPSHVLLGMGISEEDALSTIRVSMGATTSARDVDYAVAVIRKVLKGDPAGFAYLDPQHLDQERIAAEKTFLIDLRFPYERMLSPTIPGAKEWSHIFFERYFKQIPWDKEVILMCGTGIFSFSAGYRLARVGHPAVKVVYGGYAAWRNVHPELIRILKEER